MAKKKATSSDVAKKAGVSQATVSMVLNKKYNVSFSRETVEKVEMAARELGYQLPGRRNKKESKKDRLIVVFCPTITNPYYVLLLQGIETVADKQGYGVFICNTQERPQAGGKISADDADTAAPGNYLQLQPKSGFSVAGRGNGTDNSSCYYQ